MQLLRKLFLRIRPKGIRQTGREQKRNASKGSWLKEKYLNRMRISRRSRQVRLNYVLLSQYWLLFLLKWCLQNVKLKNFVREDVRKTCYPRCDKVWWRVTYYTESHLSHDFSSVPSKAYLQEQEEKLGKSTFFFAPSLDIEARSSSAGTGASQACFEKNRLSKTCVEVHS